MLDEKTFCFSQVVIYTLSQYIKSCLPAVSFLTLLVLLYPYIHHTQH